MAGCTPVGASLLRRAHDDAGRGTPYRGCVDNAARPIAGRLWPVLATVALAAIQLVGTFRAAREQVDDRPLDLLAVGLLLTGPAALVVLRRRPGLALGVVTTATLTFLLRDYAYGPVVLSQVVATVLAVVRGHRLGRLDRDRSAACPAPGAARGAT